MEYEDVIVFTKKGLKLRTEDENLKVQVLIDIPVYGDCGEWGTPDHINYCYDQDVEFEEGLTVEDFMNCLQPYFDTIDSHFIAYTRGYKIKQFFDLMQKPSVRNSDDRVSHIELHWISEISQYNNLAEGKMEIDFGYYGSYHGVPTNKDDYYIGYSLSPINDWKHLQFKINSEMKCTTFINGKRQTLFIADKKWKLYDVIRHFFYELTWHGSPTQVDELVEDLSKKSEEIMSGEAELVELDLNDFIIKGLERDKEEELKKENFEGVKRIQDEIDRLKKENESEPNL
jgi:hypothetical protein